MPALYDLVREELLQPADSRVRAMAQAIAAKYGQASRAVLFYGSCLRTAELDGQMLDFYLIVSDYEAAYGKSWLAKANRLIPPNVFPFEHEGLAAKYAVLSVDDFRRLNGPETLSVSVWARFAQPSRLVWSADEAAVERCVQAVTKAAPTLLSQAAPLSAATNALQLWREAFALTYSAELRAERKGRAASVVDMFADRYALFSAPAIEAAGVGEVRSDGSLGLRRVPERERRRTEKTWEARRRAGKLLSVLRLAKASGTFAGGIDYIAWKVNRHAGTDIAIAPWQRKWPLLGAVTLLPRLLKQRAIR